MVARNIDQRNGAAPFGPRAPRSADIKLIKQRYRQHDRIEQMVTVCALADHAQRQVDFRRRSNLHAPLGNIPTGQLRKQRRNVSTDRQIL